jgi:hypothetical protein
MSNKLSGKFVNVDTFEVVELRSREIEDSRTKDDRYVDATAVEYFSVHDWPPIVACEGRQRLRLLVHDRLAGHPLMSVWYSKETGCTISVLHNLCFLNELLFKVVKHIQNIWILLIVSNPTAALC